MSKMLDELERNELIDKLRAYGEEYNDLIDAFLLNENKVYTKKGRLNKSGACRVLGCKPKQLEDALATCRKILSNDVDLD